MGILFGKINAAVFVDDAEALISTFEEFEKESCEYREKTLEVVKQSEISDYLFKSIDTVTDFDLSSSMGLISLREPYDLSFPAIEVLQLSLEDLSYLKNSGLDDSGKKKAYLFGIRKDERKVSSSLKSKKFEEAQIKWKKENKGELAGIERRRLEEEVERSLFNKTTPETKIVECLLVPADGILYIFATGKLLKEVTSWLTIKFTCILDKQPLFQWGTQEIDPTEAFANYFVESSPGRIVHNFLLWTLYMLYKKNKTLPEDLQPAGVFKLQREKEIKTTVEYNEEIVMDEELMHKFLQPFRSESCEIVSGKFEFFIVDCFPVSFLIEEDASFFPALLCPQYEKVLKILVNDSVEETGEIPDTDEIAKNVIIRYFLMRKGYDTCKELLMMYLADEDREKVSGWL